MLKLNEGLEDEENPKWSMVCPAAGWTLRILGEDGEVGKDFPPLDRTGKYRDSISVFMPFGSLARTK